MLQTLIELKRRNEDLLSWATGGTKYGSAQELSPGTSQIRPGLWIRGIAIIGGVLYGHQRLLRIVYQSVRTEHSVRSMREGKDFRTERQERSGAEAFRSSQTF